MAAKKISPSCFPVFYHKKKVQPCLALVGADQPREDLQGHWLAEPGKDRMRSSQRRKGRHPNAS